MREPYTAHPAFAIDTTDYSEGVTEDELIAALPPGEAYLVNPANGNYLLNPVNGNFLTVVL